MDTKSSKVAKTKVTIVRYVITDAVKNLIGTNIFRP